LTGSDESGVGQGLRAQTRKAFHQPYDGFNRQATFASNSANLREMQVVLVVLLKQSMLDQRLNLYFKGCAIPSPTISTLLLLEGSKARFQEVGHFPSRDAVWIEALREGTNSQDQRPNVCLGL